MSSRNLQLLIAFIVVLAIAFFAFDSAEERLVNQSSVQLLAGINTDQIERVSIVQGATKVDIEQKDGTWAVRERGHYPADLNKLRSLLLKIVDLSVSQRVTDNEKNYDKLGVADDSYLKAGKDDKTAKVSLLDGTGNELATVLLGERKKRGPGGESNSGQFIRRLTDRQVYLLPEAIDLATSPASLIHTELLSFPSTKIKQIVQKKGDGTKLFELQAVKETEGTVRFDLDLEPSAKQEIQKTIVDSITAGLENIRIQDVSREEDENSPVKGKQFDQTTTYSLTTGAIYEIKTLADQGKGFAKISIRFDEKQVEATKADIAEQNQKKRAEFEQKKKAAEEKKEKFSEEFVELKPDVTSAEEVAKESKRLSGWVFEFPQYQIEKYRRQPVDLIKDKAEGKQ